MKNFILLGALLAAAPAFAQSQLVTCQTFSNGLNFSGQSLSDPQAQSDALSQCTSNGQTDNGDCSANMSCSDSYANPVQDCSTFSNGLNFDVQGRDPSEASQRVLLICQNNGQTNNADCSANIACNGAGAPAPVVQQCTTFSNGLNFSVQGLDPTESSQNVIAQCQKSGSTDNGDCAANVDCNGNSAPVLQCTTFSNGLNFEIDGRDPNEASQRAVAVCQTSGQTNNGDCSANISCVNSSGQQQPPVYPAPQPQPQPPVYYPPTPPAPQPPIYYPPPIQQPAPPPPPPIYHPAPQQVGLCLIEAGGNAYGDQTFNVLANTGSIIGTFNNSYDAVNFASQDSRCYLHVPQPQPPYNPGPPPQPPHNPGPPPQPPRQPNPPAPAPVQPVRPLPPRPVGPAPVQPVNPGRPLPPQPVGPAPVQPVNPIHLIQPTPPSPTPAPQPSPGPGPGHPGGPGGPGGGHPGGPGGGGH